MKTRPPKGAADVFGVTTALTAPASFLWHLRSHGWDPFHPTDLFPSLVFSAAAVTMVGIITVLVVCAVAWVFDLPEEDAKQTEG